MKKVKNFILRKKILVPVIIVVLAVAYFVYKGGENVETSLIKPSTGVFEKTISATGVVTSSTDLDLSFNKAGTVSSIKVAVGDKVKPGQVLAMLDAKNEYARVSEAQAAVKVAEAKLQKILDGASGEEINLARVSLENAKRDYENIKNAQSTLVANAYQKLLNSTPEAQPESFGNTSINAPTISGTYSLGNEGEIKVQVYNTGSGLAYSTSGLVSGIGYVNTTTAQPLGNSGLYILFSSTANLANTNWVISLPNKKASDYLTNLNAYESAKKTQDSAVASALALIDQRQAELEVKVANARPADVALAEAEVLSAKSSLAQANAAYEDNILRSPAQGTVTKVDVKLGEVAGANQSVFSVQDVENLYVEAPINESNIASVSLGQSVEVTFDALGGERVFNGTVSHIDPSSETNDGVVNYKIKVVLVDRDPNIRPGMNSEISIIVFKKESAVFIPQAAVIEENGKNYVSVMTNEETKKFENKEITLGEKGNGSMVEVLGGLTGSESLSMPK